ncbi:MAG: hypothetical protein F6K50_00510 [Moorea sp. SIO3I7]|nr:hypothetical protein [Moorena sp. SIO3I7]
MSQCPVNSNTPVLCSSPSSTKKAKPRSSGFGSTKRSPSGFGSSRGGSRSFRRRR